MRWRGQDADAAPIAPGTLQVRRSPQRLTSHHPPPPVLLPQNLLCMKLAAEMGVLVASPWVTWVKVRQAGAAPMNAPACALHSTLCVATTLHLPLLGP